MEKMVDVLIIGAGVSGIGMASRLATEQPGKSFAILERKSEIGGTWAQFKYPGVRSDSDMFTYGYKFNPWREFKTLADGGSIQNYLKDTAAQYDVSQHIHYGQHCQAADWDSEAQRWTVLATDEASGKNVKWVAKFIVSAQGYYNHQTGYTPEFKGADDFSGQIIHPQHWPKDFDASGKKVVVIGSGATAVTLVPALADKAAKVTMLQRSPTYIFSVAGFDRLAYALSRLLPARWSFAIARKRNKELWQTTYKFCQRFPKMMRRLLVGLVKKHLGEAYSDKNFNPSYEPWDQRLCAVPDADLFKAIKAGRAEVVTDHIDTFTQQGIRLKSGAELEADVIVTATGLDVQLFGGMDISVDGHAYNVAEKMIYKSVLLQDLPNFAWIFGYINLSWTMKTDMSSLYICRLFAHMSKQGWGQVTPRNDDNVATDGSIMDQLSAGYVLRARHMLPRQGTAMPWIVRNNYNQDRKMMLKTAIADPCLEGVPESVSASPKPVSIRRAA